MAKGSRKPNPSALSLRFNSTTYQHHEERVQGDTSRILAPDRWLSVSILSLAFFGGVIDGFFPLAPRGFAVRANSVICSDDSLRTVEPTVVAPDDYQNDVDRLVAMRSHPLDDLLALANKLEMKWRRINWNQYALIMMHVCSEISNRRVNDARLRQQSERFAMVTLSHSKMFAWEYQSDLVEALGYQRSSATTGGWLRERHDKAGLWLQTWRRLEIETDPSFDIKDPKNRPVSRVIPPEPRLPPGSPPSAVKDPKLRAQYAAAIADNERKSEKMLKQFPLQTHGQFLRHALS
jgi:hypothetical protein